jgi:hypothetical protein
VADERFAGRARGGMANETGYLAPGPHPSMPQQVESTIVSAASKTWRASGVIGAPRHRRQENKEHQECDLVRDPIGCVEIFYRQATRLSNVDSARDRENRTSDDECEAREPPNAILEIASALFAGARLFAGVVSKVEDYHVVPIRSRYFKQHFRRCHET